MLLAEAVLCSLSSVVLFSQVYCGFVEVETGKILHQAVENLGATSPGRCSSQHVSRSPPCQHIPRCGQRAAMAVPICINAMICLCCVKMQGGSLFFSAPPSRRIAPNICCVSHHVRCCPTPLCGRVCVPFADGFQYAAPLNRGAAAVNRGYLCENELTKPRSSRSPKPHFMVSFPPNFVCMHHRAPVFCCLSQKVY